MKQRLDVSNGNLLDSEEYSNFRFLGIGKPTAKQLEKDKKREEKKEERKENREERREDRKENRAEAKAERQSYKGKGRILNIINKFNPVTATARAGFLAMVRLNLFGLASKLYPIVASNQELSEKKYKKNFVDEVRGKSKKIKDIYFKVGGRGNSLEEAIRKGVKFKVKGIKNGDVVTSSTLNESSKGSSKGGSKITKAKEKKSGFNGLPMKEGFPYQVYLTKPVVEPYNSLKPQYIDIDFSNADAVSKSAGAALGAGAGAVASGAVAFSNPATASIVAAGMTIASAILLALPKEDPFQEGSEESNDFNSAMSDSEFPESDPNALNQLEDSAKADLSLGGDSNTYEKETKSLENEINDEVGELPFYKTTTGIIVLSVSAVLVLVGGYFLIKKLKK